MTEEMKEQGLDRSCSQENFFETGYWVIVDMGSVYRW